MKKLFFLLCALLVATYCQSQISDYKELLNNDAPISDISLIKTTNDFDQNNLTQNEIDIKIKELIYNSKTQNNLSLDIPFNSKKLKYVGKKHPNDYLTFSHDAFTTRLNHLNKECEIYEYDTINIFIESKDNKNILNLFFTLRALTIIKVKYPEAYSKLIQQNISKNATSYILQAPYRRPSTLNKNNSIISFDNSPIDIAASTTDLFFGSQTNIGGWDYYENTNNLVMSIDNETILGDQDTKGSKPIYKFEDKDDNYFNYMRDGLIESIIHEFVHLYITNSVSIDEKSFFINEMRNDTTDKNFDIDVEEAIVLNTCLKYYKTKGGISYEVLNFYEKMLQTKQEILTKTFNYSDKLNLQRYYALKSLSKSTAKNFEDIYFLNILN
ncbi:hypothetical protein [Algibacter sp. L3A6]|uniref:hypothetical protein n=1 Tax=Algibacter sp. L3A6 TaxID=2686366 RepID=UPI00131AB161|nr:hypothetical protein [Algibacter sp. L3A6]